MPSPTQSFMDAVRAHILAVEPAVSANGVWETPDIREMDFEGRALPYWVMEVEEERDDPDFCGLNNNAYRVTLNLWRIDREEGGLDALREKLHAIELALYATELAYGQFIEAQGHNTDGNNEANGVLREKLLPHYGGYLRAAFTYGEMI